MVALPDGLFTPLQGGVPIVIDGQAVGGVGVSGAASAQQDEEIAIAGANIFGAPMTNSSAMNGIGPVNYFNSQMVTAAFSKGAVLLDDSDGRNYMVHASHRDKAGLAEIHTLDTDIVYVLEGTATFVTGGTAVDPKTNAPNEIRGSAIEGGESRKLVKGDVIVVPRGVPHWFKEVSSPFNYYVVKVR
jgi:glc operon protein GlcG